MKTILVLNGQYLPGYKGGGPIQSCVNMIENLSDKFKFKVICADRDYKSTEPYKAVKINEWNEIGSASVYYMSPEKQNFKGFKEVLNGTDYDVLYFNGFFSPIFTVKPLILRRLGKLKQSRGIIAARGDFTGGLENKRLKKYAYIGVAKIIGLYKRLLWHVTSDMEKDDVKKFFPKEKVFCVANLPAKYEEKSPVTIKEKGKLRLVFISRIFPKKNLLFALEVLKDIKEGEIIFDIYGPMEDKSYWAECKKKIVELPKNVKAQYCGEISHEDIPRIFEQYHAFFFPTLGENYGHIIVEAMMNNCLCILSKGVTPWDGYIEIIGLGAELKETQRFVNDIEYLVQIGQDEFERLIELNNNYIRNNNPQNDVNRYCSMFNGVEE